MACTYASRGFIPDVLSAIPFDAIGRAFGGGGNQTHMIILKLFRLPRLLRLSRLLRKVRLLASFCLFTSATRFSGFLIVSCSDFRGALMQLEHMSSATLFRVAVLVSAYVLIGHWAACGFFYISKWQVRLARAKCLEARLTHRQHRLSLQLAHSESGWVENSAGLRPWIVTQCLQFERAPVRYVASLYFALTTMATVGFGDVTPGSNMERCFAMALQLVAGVLQGVVFGNIGVALAGFDRSSAAVKAVKRDACALARAAGLPNSLARRLAVAASAQALATQQLDTTDALSELTGTIRCDAEAATAGACALAATPLVRCAMPPLPRGFSAAVARRLRVMALPSGEFATTAGDADGDTFLLLHGSVRITPPQGGFDARIGAATTVHAPALVAISDAVLCQRASAHVRARGHATLLVISRACLDDALEEFPEALAPLTAHALINDAWHRTDAGSSTPMVAAVAAAAASQIFVERQSTRKGGFGGGSASGSNVLLPGSVGAAILEAPVPMLTALRTGGAGVGQAALSASGGDAAPNTPAAAARWSKAGTAARMVVRLAGVVHGNELQRAAETREHVATPRVAADPLAGADWTAFNARLHAFVSAQADAFAALEMRLSAINPALSSTVDPASAF